MGLRLCDFVLIAAAAGILISCGENDREAPAEPSPIQERLLEAQPGDTILIEEGTHELTRQLTLMDVENVTIKGEGMDKTILSFRDQVEGAEGLLVSADGITIEDLAVVDTKGDGIKVLDSDGVTMRGLRVTWTGGPSEENGDYGLYPVGSRNILIEHCEVSGAADAGIYVGQSEDAVVRHNRVFENVAGIEIENTIRADVYENDARNNTGGILVFDLPELLIKNGRDIRIFNNRVEENNHRNFASPGTTVAMVPAGTGVLVMAKENVEIFDNDISGHNTVNTAVTSYLITELEYDDPEYIPYPAAVHIYDNRFSRTPALPDTTRMMGQLLAGLFGPDVPDIILDGAVNPDYMRADGTVEPGKRICIDEDQQATLANINAPAGFAEVITDPEPYRCPPDVLEAMKMRFENTEVRTQESE